MVQETQTLRRLLRVFVVTAALWLTWPERGVCQVAVEINPKTNVASNPVVESFSAGAYVAVPVDNEAWSPWPSDSDPACSPDCWHTTYTIATSGGFVRINPASPFNGFHSSKANAYSNMRSQCFVLDSTADVDFYVPDNLPSDNRGAVHLDVSDACDDVNDTLSLSGTVSTTVEEKAYGQITASSYTITSSGDATLTSGTRVRLESGFSVAEGGSFLGEISTDAEICCWNEWFN